MIDWLVACTIFATPGLPVVWAKLFLNQTDVLPDARQMWVQRKRRLVGRKGCVIFLQSRVNEPETSKRAEMSRLQLQSLLHVANRCFVLAPHIMDGRSHIPTFREVRRLGHDTVEKKQGIVEFFLLQGKESLVHQKLDPDVLMFSPYGPNAVGELRAFLVTLRFLESHE